MTISRLCFIAVLMLLSAAPICAQQEVGPSLQSVVDVLGRALSPPTVAEQLPAPAPGAPVHGIHVPFATISPDAEVNVEVADGLISLSVRDASLRQVMAALAETQGLNLVFASPADVPVTAQFDRTPLRQVIESLLASNGHTWSIQDGVIFVTSTSSSLGITPHVQGRRVAVIELDFASAADIQPAIAGLLSPIGQSYFVETNSADNRRTKEMLIVEDLSEYVDRIELHIAELDQPPRQVLIEVHLLEVDLDDDERFGVNFDALARVSGAELNISTTGLANPLASPAFFIESSEGDLDFLLEALINTTDAKTLAAPRILAINGQESRIQIGEQLGFRVTTTTETSTLESVDFLDVGVVLRVTPRITRDGRVLMRIAPEVSSGAVNPDTGLPEEETTELETDALLTSGQGMVIGGLIQERDELVISRVPFFSTLPYVNFLFQRRQEVKRRSELVVALVPHVLPYEPIQHARDQHDFNRAFDPLTYGPLCEYPRPYEPRLPDPYTDRAGCQCLIEHGKRCNGSCRVGRQPQQWPHHGCRRLPPVEEPRVAEPELAEEPSPAAPVVQATHVPAGPARWSR